MQRHNLYKVRCKLAGQCPKEFNMYIITLSAGKVALANNLRIGLENDSS